MLKNKKYKYSLIYGIFGSLGFICLFEWYTMACFNEFSKYPYRYPISIVTGIISLIICVINLIDNIKNLKEEKNKVKIIIIELLFTTILFVLFLCTFGFIDSKI